MLFYSITCRSNSVFLERYCRTLLYHTHISGVSYTSPRCLESNRLLQIPFTLHFIGQDAGPSFLDHAFTKKGWTRWSLRSSSNLKYCTNISSISWSWQLRMSSNCSRVWNWATSFQNLWLINGSSSLLEERNIYLSMACNTGILHSSLQSKLVVSAGVSSHSRW